MPRLSFEAVVLIDEAEKTFKSEEDSHILLKLIDGVFNMTRKLYILTTNTLRINDNLLGRPGRIRYIQEFTNLPKETVEEYLKDTLIDQSKADEVMGIVDLLEISTIDIIKSIVEEYNIFGNFGTDGDASKSIMNIPRANYVFDAIRFRGYSEEDFGELMNIIEEYKPDNLDLNTWFMSRCSSTKDIEEPINETVNGSCEKDSVIKGDSVTKDKDAGVEEERSGLDIFSIGDNKYAYSTKITSKFATLFKNTETNQGIVLSEENKDGFVLIKSNYSYEPDADIYFVIGAKGNPSIYKQYVL